MLDDEAFARAWVESRDRARRAASARSARSSGSRASTGRRSTSSSASVARRPPGSPSDDGEVAITPDQAAAERLLARNARSLARVADPRQRRQRAYALLARNGFDPEVCRTVAGAGRDRTPTDEPPEDD